MSAWKSFFNIMAPFHSAAICGALWERHRAPCRALRSSKMLIDRWLVSNWSPWSPKSPSVDSLAQKSVAIRSERLLLDRIDRNRIANWSPISPTERNWNSTNAIAALSNPITKMSMTASFVTKLPFYNTYCDYISCSFGAISRFISPFIHTDCKRFRFTWRECCDQLFHAQLVANYYSN